MGKLQIQNPILSGFHPDPCILRVGEDYYIATSTFEWFPGVRIFHSKNLRDWELIATPLEEEGDFDLSGIPASGGVWAPDLSWREGSFYLVYTVTRSYDGIFKDCANYLVTARDIQGPWSRPSLLHGIGFDPSLFHDEDGRTWLLSMQQDFGYGRSEFGGIVLQEYDRGSRRLLGDPRLIFPGTELGTTEGPRLYRREGYYYLLTAEGGTEYTHAVTVARSRRLEGPYEIHPHNPILTTVDAPQGPLQKCGHGCLVESSRGTWYMAHLCSRPVGMQRMCILGRETALQRICWEEGWPYLAHGTHWPLEQLEIETEGEGSYGERPGPYMLREEFDGVSFSRHLQTLRVPLGERASLKARPGWLRLYGAESPQSNFCQSLLAHRQQHFYCQATTKLEFAASDPRQMAGLIYYYDNYSYFYLFATVNRQGQPVLNLLSLVMGRATWPLGDGIQREPGQAVWLKLKCRKETAQFLFSADGERYQEIGPKVDAVVLSDDYFYKFGQYRFTGAFIGICCQDLTGRKNHGDFDFFEYKEG